MSSQDLMQLSNAVKATYDAEVSGLDELGSGDYATPFWKLMQGTTCTAEEMGKYKNTLTGEIVDELEIVPVRCTTQRILFPQPYSPDSVPICKSDDARTPNQPGVKVLEKGRIVKADETGKEIGETCATCRYSLWGSAGETPLCSFVYVYLVLDNTGMPSILQLKRTAISAAKQINTMLRLQRTIILGVKKQTSPGGLTFHVPIVRLGNPIPQPLLELRRDLIKSGMAERSTANVDLSDAETQTMPNDDEAPF